VDETRGVTVISGIISPTVVEWAERARPGGHVAGWVVRPLTGHHEPLELVREHAPAHEIAGLRAA
jgi:hypothetical protein